MVEGKHSKPSPPRITDDTCKNRGTRLRVKNSGLLYAGKFDPVRTQNNTDVQNNYVFCVHTGSNYVGLDEPHDPLDVVSGNKCPLPDPFLLLGSPFFSMKFFATA